MPQIASGFSQNRGILFFAEDKQDNGDLCGLLPAGTLPRLLTASRFHTTQAARPVALS
jgi:hypothetical protein